MRQRFDPRRQIAEGFFQGDGRRQNTPEVLQGFTKVAPEDRDRERVNIHSGQCVKTCALHTQGKPAAAAEEVQAGQRLPCPVPPTG